MDRKRIWGWLRGQGGSTTWGYSSAPSARGWDRLFFQRWTAGSSDGSRTACGSSTWENNLVVWSLNAKNVSFKWSNTIVSCHLASQILNTEYCMGVCMLDCRQITMARVLPFQAGPPLTIVSKWADYFEWRTLPERQYLWCESSQAPNFYNL